MSSWVRRWCHVQGNRMEVFASPQDSTPLSSYELSTTTQIQPSEKQREGNCFEIILSTKDKPIVFKTEGPEELSAWMNALLQASVMKELGVGEHAWKTSPTNSSEKKLLVLAIKGMFSSEHGDRVEGLVQVSLDASCMQLVRLYYNSNNFDGETRHQSGKLPERCNSC